MFFTGTPTFVEILPTVPIIIYPPLYMTRLVFHLPPVSLRRDWVGSQLLQGTLRSLYCCPYGHRRAIFDACFLSTHFLLQYYRNP